MAFTSAESKMVIAFNNRATPLYINTVALANGNAVADASHPVANLKYEDAWRMFKVNATPTGNTSIDVTFSAAQTFTCFGIINHDLWTRGYSIDLQYHNGSTYVSIGTTALGSDGNLLLRFASQAATIWRIVLTRSTPWTPYTLGAIFFGTYVELSNQPTEGGYQVSFGLGMDRLQTVGDVRHVLFGADLMSEDLEITFERVSQATQFILIESIARANKRKLIAIIQPSQVKNVLPQNFQHFFGRLQTITPREVPSFLSATTHKADVVLRASGAL